MNRTQHANNKGRQARAEFWNRHIENQNNSDLTQVEYCRQNDLNRHTFSYWKTKLNKKETFRPFLPVSIQPETTPDNPSFPSGISLSFNDRFDVHCIYRSD